MVYSQVSPGYSELVSRNAVYGTIPYPHTSISNKLNGSIARRASLPSRPNQQTPSPLHTLRPLLAPQISRHPLSHSPISRSIIFASIEETYTISTEQLHTKNSCASSKHLHSKTHICHLKYDQNLALQANRQVSVRGYSDRSVHIQQYY